MLDTSVAYIFITRQHRCESAALRLIQSTRITEKVKLCFRCFGSLKALIKAHQLNLQEEQSAAAPDACYDFIKIHFFFPALLLSYKPLHLSQLHHIMKCI